MILASFKLREDYWESFQLQEQDIEFLYNYLLETETPLTNQELLHLLIQERVRSEKAIIDKQRTSGGDVYFPKENYQLNQKVIFPALDWRNGKVVNVRAGNNPEYGEFEVVQVAFENGEKHEYASGFPEHVLNNPPEIEVFDETLDSTFILNTYGEILVKRLEEGLKQNSDFVPIAGRWFPKALLVDMNVGHLNLAEAILDMAGGGPLPTQSLIDQIEISSNVNPKLLEFSLDYALQEDNRFDEVGTAGEVKWFLNRLEPKPVLEPPLWLRYQNVDYSRSVLTPEMLALECSLDDELSPIENKNIDQNEVEVCLIFPHWRAGTIPLSERTRTLFPTAYESPRIRFTIVDGETQEKFPAWVVRPHSYIYGLKEWYEKRGLLPGSLIKIKKGNKPGEVILRRNTKRASREWMRTLLVGSDGGIVFAMLKQNVQSNYDERMAIAIPDIKALDEVWEKSSKEKKPFEKIVVDMVRELTKLNPQSHVHATELYAGVNIIRRCPPGPILELLVSRPWFTHVGDLHFRFSDTERPN